MKTLRTLGIEVPLSVNVAGSEISRSDFVARFEATLKEMGISTKEIEIEVTETQLIEVMRTASGCLDRLGELGVRVSIDDFGAGYSSLSYLSMLNASVLKIDRQFIARMTQSSQDQQIVKMIIELGHLLKMEVIAEGIETEKQYQVLQQLGCDAGQGYFIGRPMSLEAVQEWLSHHQGDA
ncbi:MAG: hypothetical protein DSY86_00195 [Marinomonas sp.]|nr:MAG: hypothetical protein DSY86_00195 [Marinomonas sp.]